MATKKKAKTGQEVTAQEAPVNTAGTKEQVSPTTLEKIARNAMARTGLSTIYCTSDGTAFRLKTDAINHASCLANHTVTRYDK